MSLPAPRRLATGGFQTLLHDAGSGRDGQPPLLMLHGSGPGVSAWANWRLALRLTNLLHLHHIVHKLRCAYYQKFYFYLYLYN